MEAVRRPVRSRHHRQVEVPEERSLSEVHSNEVPPVETEDITSELGIVWEKSKKKPTKKVSKTESGAIGDTQSTSQVSVDTIDTSRGAGVDSGPTAPPLEEIDTIIDDYKTQKAKIVEQHVLIQSKKEFLKQTKENERTKIVSLFSDILDILADKEASLLCKLDQKYVNHEDKLEELLTATEEAIESINTETNIAENLKAGDSHFNDISLDEIKPLLSDIKTGIEERDGIVMGDTFTENEIPSIEVNDAAVNVINDLVYVKISGSDDAVDNNDNDIIGADEQDAMENTETDSIPLSPLESTEDRTETDEQNTDAESETNVSESETRETVETGMVSEMSNLQVDVCHPSPTAPPQPQEEEDPPPYWQAIGLSGPAEDTAGLPSSRSPTTTSSEHVPHYSEAPRYSEARSGVQQSNELLFYHNFPLKRQYDSRSPKPVALKWNMDKICVADRANSKVKVYSSSGGVITEMYLGGCEIYDMAFIEAKGEDLRYVITIPRAKTLMFISICTNQPPRLLYKLKTQRGYTAVAKGPSGFTLVCADALPNSGEPRVDIVNNQGTVLRSFRTTCSLLYFSYPRCVEVFDQYIIVADWKLNIVVVLDEDEGPVAQYGGTPHYPLKDPHSLTLDHCGNIMIVDGKTGNIHVIDLQCKPLEIIKCPRGQISKLISFDKDSHRLAVYRQSGDVAVYDFKGGYRTVSRNLGVQQMRYMNQPEYQGVLPLVEGMLPSTIANIPVGGGRQRQATRFINQPEYQGSIPLVDGMLPSTIANIPSATGRQRPSNMRGNYSMFHL